MDPVTLLLAVERVGAEVAALGRTLAAQPAEVAAQLDVDAATASIGVRVGALGSALDQFRLSLLAALDRTVERLDEPAWLPGLRAALTELEPRLDSPPWLPALQASLAELADRHELHEAADRLAEVERSLADLQGVRPAVEAIADLELDRRLDELTAAAGRAADDPGERLAKLERAVAELGDGVRAGAAVADALDHLGERLASIEDAAGRVADDARILVEQVSPVPDRLSAIASQVDRITPLARAGDQAGTLFDQLDRVGAALEEAVDLLRASSGRPPGPGQEDEIDERFEAVVDVLAGVTRRQDQVTVSIASALDQMRGPRSVDSVLERMEQRERSLAARLDRIDAELRQRGGAPGSPASAERKADAETARALEAVVARIEQQERLMGFRLDQIDAELQRVGEVAAAGAQADEPDTEAAELLRSVLDRVDEHEATIGRHLAWVGERLSEVAAHLAPADVHATATVDEDEDGGDHGPSQAILEVLAARRQDELAAKAALAQEPREPAPARPESSPAAAEAAALRLARLRAERAEVQARLQEERLLARTWNDDEL